MVESLFIDGNDADLDRTHGFVKINAERNALYLGGLRYQLFDVSFKIFKAAVVVKNDKNKQKLNCSNTSGYINV